MRSSNQGRKVQRLFKPGRALAAIIAAACCSSHQGGISFVPNSVVLNIGLRISLKEIRDKQRGYKLGWSFEKVGDCDFFLSLDGGTLNC